MSEHKDRLPARGTLLDMLDRCYDQGAEIRLVVSTGVGQVKGTVSEVGEDYVSLLDHNDKIVVVAVAHIVTLRTGPE